MSLDKDVKRDIITEYKQKKTSGGVYKITNSVNGKYMIKAEIDLQSFQNRFEFTKKIGGYLHPKMRLDVEQYGADAFELKFLEEVEKKPEESPKAFKDRLVKLEEKWLEKEDPELKY